MVMNKPKNLFWDMEITGILGWSYDLWESRIHHVERMPTMLCFSYWWEDDFTKSGKRKIKFESIQFQSEEELVQKLWNLFDEADYVTAFNGNSFDNKWAVSKFQDYKMLPPSPYKQIDPFRMSKAVARRPSHSLQNLSEAHGNKGKAKETHKELWHDCMDGDPLAWKKMKIYNDQDVNALADEYYIQRPWSKSHPNFGDFAQVDGVCPKCGSDVRPYGSAPRRGGRVKTYICNSEQCGARSNEATLKGNGRLVSA